MSFNKVTPDLSDPRQNEFVQDYLSAMQMDGRRYRDEDPIEAAIELVQEIYSPTPPQVPYEVQVKQHQIEQLKATQRQLEREVANHYATIRTMSCELTTAHDKVRKLEAKFDRALDVLQEHE